MTIASSEDDRLFFFITISVERTTANCSPALIIHHLQTKMPSRAISFPTRRGVLFGSRHTRLRWHWTGSAVWGKWSGQNAWERERTRRRIWQGW